jgi:hypothetical protein
VCIHNHYKTRQTTKQFAYVILLIICCLLDNKKTYSHSLEFNYKNDSLKIYKKIKQIAYKNKIGSWMYDAIFHNPEAIAIPTNKILKDAIHTNPYLKFKGCIIKSIKITVYDPFGYDANDSIKYTINKVQQFGNRTHITTRQFVINNKLLFKQNDSINPLAITESERILREAVFITDASIIINTTSNKDSVIVNVIVNDKWPITIPLVITDLYTSARFRNLNLFGVGQQFEQYAKFTKPNDYELNGYYSIANIDHTYISSTLAYSNNKTETTISIAFDKPFFSPLTSWAGGLASSHGWKTYQYKDTIANEQKEIKLTTLANDFWLGKSFKLVKLKKDNSIFNQSTNLILGARHYSTLYLNKPNASTGAATILLNSKVLLSNIAISIQHYYKDKYIYRFGANEDVPEGLIMQIIYGGVTQEFKKIRYYAGIELARAKHFKFGYLSSTLSSGIFFNKLTSNDITTNYKLYYFSNLLKSGKWFFRAFVNLNYVNVQNKLNGETLNFSTNELYGFENNSLSGSSKMSISSELVAYLPYQFIGFRFAPIINIGLGLIENQAHKLYRSNLYQSYTIGLLLRNENLLTSTFQFSVGAYPYLPGNGKFTIKYNPIASFTLRVRAFSVNKPEFVTSN